MIYRNPKLLALAKEAPQCFCCGKPNDGTVVAAHANMQSMGKGMGIKAADIPAYVCSGCHDDIDGRGPTGPITTLLGRNNAWSMSAVKSMRWALETHPEAFK